MSKFRDTKDLKAAIRTNCSSIVGLGHLARCKRIANALQNKGYKTIFFLDTLSDAAINYLSPFIAKEIYSNEILDFSEGDDAETFLSAISSYRPTVVLVDDYRLSIEWEKKINNIYPLIVLDDENKREHFCDILTDPNWTGNGTQERYRGLLPENALKLLGPKFLLIDQPKVVSGAVHNINPRSKAAEINSPYILLSLGGGGDMLFMVKLLQALKGCKNSVNNTLLVPIVGPLASNVESLIRYSMEVKGVLPVLGETELHPYFSGAELFIGASGGMIYEALIARAPSLTFALTSNQIHEHSDFEPFGHFLHLNKFQINEADKLAYLAWTLMRSIERVKSLALNHRRIELDYNGAQRIVDAIQNLANKNFCCETADGKLHIAKNETNLSENQVTNRKLIKVDDTHINKYLKARNLEINRLNMSSSEMIDELDHYAWWFQTKRSSYVYCKNDEPQVYCWHQVLEVLDCKFIVGGFFSASESATGLDSLDALWLQHQITDAEYPSLPWLAITKKTNKFANALNVRLGFERISPDNSFYPALEKTFPEVKCGQYICYIKQF